jgi:hypothetical protein
MMTTKDVSGVNNVCFENMFMEEWNINLLNCLSCNTSKEKEWFRYFKELHL